LSLEREKSECTHDWDPEDLLEVGQVVDAALGTHLVGYLVDLEGDHHVVGHRCDHGVGRVLENVLEVTLH
jgi:hypothetical protein